MESCDNKVDMYDDDHIFVISFRASKSQEVIVSFLFEIFLFVSLLFETCRRKRKKKLADDDNLLISNT